MEWKITIAICDDEKVYRESTERLCREFFEDRGKEGPFTTVPEIYVFASGKELAASDREFDILLLDIEMPEQDGIRMKECFEVKRKQTRIIFTTVHKERVMEAFGKNVVSFLLKPLCREEFRKVMEKTLSELRAPLLELSENGETFLIPIKQIRYIEAQDKYTLAVTQTGKYLLRKTMKFWEDTLPGEDFVRIHKSYLVHLEYFEKRGEEVVLEERKTVKISRLRKEEVKEKYREFLRRKVKGI